MPRGSRRHHNVRNEKMTRYVGEDLSSDVKCDFALIDSVCVLVLKAKRNFQV